MEFAWLCQCRLERLSLVGETEPREVVSAQARQAAMQAEQEKASLQEILADKDEQIGLLQEELRHQPGPTQHFDAAAEVAESEALRATGGVSHCDGDAVGRGAHIAQVAPSERAEAKSETLLDTAALLQRQVFVRPCPLPLRCACACISVPVRVKWLGQPTWC